MFKIRAQGEYFKWNRKVLKKAELNGKLYQAGDIHSAIVQGSLRPSILGTWEYVFPEECLATVVSMMGIQKNITSTKQDFKTQFKDKTKLAVLRKILGVKPIPKEILKKAETIPDTLSIKDSWRGLNNLVLPGVAIHVIGIKKDERKEIEKWNLEQEML